MKKIFTLLLTLSMVLAGCAVSTGTEESVSVQKPLSESTSDVKTEKYDINSEGNVIYLAGGCFWGMQKYLQSIPGVIDTATGFANGVWDKDVPLTYKDVTTGETGFRETVYVEYDPEKVSLEAILFSYFYVIDPTVKDRQGPDVGTEYQTGIYYTNERTKEVIDKVVEIEKERYDQILVEIEPLEVFYEAEEEHQDYLDKNPDGYCHIAEGQINWMTQIIVDPADYPRPSKEEIKERLTPLQYQVTQENYTEEPFNNEYWDFFEKGIYVDIVTGEPLFSSLDKFESPCGWAAFAKGIDINTFFFTLDNSTGDDRIEVRGRTSNAHLGHLFQGEPDSPTGSRYCINSAAVRFVPFEEMDEEGYGYLKYLFDETEIHYETITAEKAKEIMDKGEYILLDVREEFEYAEGHIPGANLLPVRMMSPSSVNKIAPDRDGTVLIYCRSGNRSKVAAQYMIDLGYTNVYEFGGIQDWPYETVKDEE